MKENEKQILELKEQIDDLQQIEKYVAELDKRIKKEKKRLRKLERIADEEYQDIIDLEQKTFVDFFVDYSEEKEKQKEKEKEEYMAAVMDCRNASRTIKSLEFEASVLKDKLVQLPDLKVKLKVYLNLRKGDLIKVPSKKVEEINPNQLLQLKIDAKLEAILESIDQIGGRLGEIDVCLDRILTWSNILGKYEENRKRHILRDIANLEAAMVWLRSEVIQLKIKMAIFRQDQDLDELVNSTSFTNYKKSYKRLQNAANDFMSKVVNNEMTAMGLSQKCTLIKGLAKSLEYELKQLKHYVK